MTTDSPRIAVVAGDGAVIRRGATVVVLGGAVDDDVVTEVESLLAVDQRDERIRGLAAMFLRRGLPAAAVVDLFVGGADAFAVGALDVVADGQRRGASAAAMGVSGRYLDGSLEAIVGEGAEVSAPAGWVRLDDGAVIGAGIIVGEGAAVVPPAEPAVVAVGMADDPLVDEAPVDEPDSMVDDGGDMSSAAEASMVDDGPMVDEVDMGAGHEPEAPTVADGSMVDEVDMGAGHEPEVPMAGDDGMTVDAPAMDTDEPDQMAADAPMDSDDGSDHMASDEPPADESVPDLTDDHVVLPAPSPIGIAESVPAPGPWDAPPPPAPAAWDAPPPPAPGAWDAPPPPAPAAWDAPPPPAPAAWDAPPPPAPAAWDAPPPADIPPPPVGGSLDTAAEPESHTPAYQRPVRVRGTLSPAGFFNHPEASACRESGIEMGVGITRVLVEGDRPTLGEFTFDDGATHLVQWDTVMGRDPGIDERVAAGTVAPLVLADDALKISRRHVLVELVDWEVHVTDLDTANGTYVRDRADQPPRRLTPGERTRLRSGAEVFLGDRSFTFTDHNLG